MKKTMRAQSLAAAAVVAGIITAFAGAGAAVAAEAEIIGEGSVVLDFTTTPGSVDITVWTHNLSTVEAWGTVVIQDKDGTVHPAGPEHYDAGEERSYFRSLPDYSCADLGSGAVAVAFGFSGEELGEPDWTGEPLSYPDPRLTVIGCESPAPPAEVPADPGTPATNTLPAAKTDGSLLAGESHSSPLFGLAVTLGAILTAAVGGSVTGVLRRR